MSELGSPQCLLAIDDKVASLTLCRPPMNGLTPSYCDDLTSYLDQAISHPGVRAVVVRAQGPCFSVGADLKWAAQELKGGGGAKALSDLVRAMHRTILTIYSSPKPVVSLIEGAAAGGGMALGLAADVRLASSTAFFRLAYPTVSISLDGGTSFRLPQLMGATKTSAWLFHDRDIPAETALEWGLVHQVSHDPTQLLQDWLARLAVGPTAAWAKSKFLLNPPEVVAQKLEREAEQIEALGQCRDTWHGVECFLTKKQPEFEGR